jgi:hypothetical protein
MNHFTTAIGLAVALSISACSNNKTTNKSPNTMETTDSRNEKPVASQFASSPLRNRIKLELNAPLEEVWPLVGDPGRMPEYSDGLQSVETKKDADGNCTEYLCHFKPMAPGEKGVDHRAIIKWYEPFQGWASIDDEPNFFGFKESLTLVTFESYNDKTIIQWDMHFNAVDVEMNKGSLELALNDISARLISRFGGRVLENFVEGKSGE